jgi:hypothetical protein
MKYIELDFDGFYTVKGYSGVAWRIEPRQILVAEHRNTDAYGLPDPYWGEEDLYEVDDQTVWGIMVGDDRRHVIDVTDLEWIEDDAFCRECGSTGCMHGR